VTVDTESRDVAEVLAHQWGITAAECELLGGELDRTYRVQSSDGSLYCVKVRHEAGAEFELELAALTHLDDVDDIALPRLVPTTEGHSSWRDGAKAVWVLQWLDGLRWADLSWRSPALARDLGHRARQLSDALQSFEHPAAHRSHHWDARIGSASIKQHADQTQTAEQRAAVERVLRLLTGAESDLADLPQSVVHQDLNDHNILVHSDNGAASIAGIIDFGDLLHSATITELVVAVAYAMLRTEQPIDAAAEVVAGWYGEQPPADGELGVIFPLALGRLMVNALTWSARREAQPDYADARSRHTWDTIDRLIALPTSYVEERFGQACSIVQGHDASMVPNGEWISACNMVDLDPRRDAFDGVDVLDVVDPADPTAVWSALGAERPFAVRHDTVRMDLGGFADGNGGPATVQLGVELHLDPGTPVVLPVAGELVESGTDRLVVSHGDLWSLWTGVGDRSDLTADYQLEQGAVIGSVSAGASGQPLPVHVQLLRFEPSVDEAVPTFVRAADRAAWTALSVDPSPFLGLAVDSERLATLDDGEVRAKRNTKLASSQRYYFREPMTLVRSKGVTFVDSAGRHYLDAINNVTHVGHGNERVAAAAQRQLLRLNTNSRFVYEQMGAYAERLADRLPDPLDVVFLVCTGSEANDLALRISRQVTGNNDIMVVDGAYHGNTTAVTGISPNRYKGAGGQGPPPTTHEVEQPNRYRGRFGHDDVEAGTHYADSVRTVADRLVAEGRPPAAFIAESLMGTAGQVVYPPGYLAESFAAVRAAGGLCISDEVQVGFGRLGTHFWGFEQGGVVPDIVTMGKPMGNGHPIAAVVTTREIADAFDQGMKYFNTFGGNPVSCAVAGAVLDEIDEHGLQAHALQTGGRFLDELRNLMAKHERIGDVRGEGLYLGVEFVADRTTKEPLTALTTEVCERMREHGVIMYPNGVLGNCLKIKPPMPFDDRDTDQFIQTLDLVLRELPA